MLLLLPAHEPVRPARRPTPLIALFGVGLLGSAIRDAMLRRHYRSELMALDWQDPELQRRQLRATGERIEAATAESKAAGVDFVWAAGRAGFGSAESETASELDSFRAVLALCGSLASPRSAPTPRFHLLSSVGGLFEGQRYVGRGSTPGPLRPYGRLKLRQEEFLAARETNLAKRIYRLTSVFGPAPEGRRRGLISTLIRNGRRQRVTRIVGHLSTLRDFVWTEDVARYLEQRLLDPTRDPGVRVHTLAAGKPSSIREVLGLVEGIIGRRLYVQFDPGLSNSTDITVSPGVLAAGWSPSDLKTAVRRVSLA